MGTQLLGPVHVGMLAQGWAGLQHVFLAKRTEHLGLLPSILATNLHVRDEVMLLNHLMTNFARKHNDAMVDSRCQTDFCGQESCTGHTCRHFVHHGSGLDAAVSHSPRYAGLFPPFVSRQSRQLTKSSVMNDA